jgi:hypothetical protein
MKRFALHPFPADPFRRHDTLKISDHLTAQPV